MTTFDAVTIEHTLARFFGTEIGDRSTTFDADVFRAGAPKDLSKVLELVADTFEKRIASLSFPVEGNGTAKAQVEGCVSRLRDLAARVKARRSPEREDYHWEVFGALMMGIVGLLETVEALCAAKQ